MKYKLILLIGLLFFSEFSLAQGNTLCAVYGKTDQSKTIYFSKERFSNNDLKDVNKQNFKGVYLNIFDYLGFNLYMFENGDLTISVEKEESKEKITKTFSRLPASVQTKVSFSAQKNNKNVNINEISIVCKKD